jgi:hypothetical protein
MTHKTKHQGDAKKAFGRREWPNTKNDTLRFVKKRLFIWQMEA